MELRGKVALITGGATRIGRAITLGLAHAGCHVFIHYGQSAEQAKRTRDDAKALGVRAELLTADLANAKAVQRVVPAAQKAFGGVDILINNAAIFPEKDTFLSADGPLWEGLFAVNLRAPFFLCRAFAAQVPKDKQGKIINITDSRVRRPASEHFVYRLTKGCLWQMTEMMALELAPRIAVNAVALGAILPSPGKDDEYLKKIAQASIPLKRHGSAETVAQSVVHLLQQDFLTGVILPIDGGATL
jgi:glucose 1-dehydrogenase